MAKRPAPIEESLAGELYNCLLDFIDKNKAIPLQRSLWWYLIETKQYTVETLTQKRFDYHFNRLRLEGYIAIEPYTRSVKPLRNVRIEIVR